jgi:hypothetical protein
MHAGVVMPMAIHVDMLRRHFMMHMDHAGHVIVVGQARSEGMFSGQSIGDRRRQDAKQVGQGNEPRCSQSPRSGKPDEHTAVNFSLLRSRNIAAKIAPAKPELGPTITFPRVDVFLNLITDWMIEVPAPGEFLDAEPETVVITRMLGASEPRFAR